MDQNYDKADVLVAVHGFNPLTPEDPDTKDFKTVAQDRLREAYRFRIGEKMQANCMSDNKSKAAREQNNVNA